MNDAAKTPLKKANHEFGNQKACLETLFLRLPGIYYQSNNTDTAYLAGTTRNGVEFGMDNNIFELLMLLFVIITTIHRFFKGRKVKKTRSQLVALAPLINASVDPGRQSISGKIDDVPFKVKYEPQGEQTPARLDVILDKTLPFSMNVTARTTEFEHQQAVQTGEFLLEDRKFDETYSVTTNNTEDCRAYLKDPLFRQGIEFAISHGYSIRFTRRRAVFTIPNTGWLAESDQAAKSLIKTLQLGHSLIGEFD